MPHPGLRDFMAGPRQLGRQVIAILQPLVSQGRVVRIVLPQSEGLAGESLEFTPGLANP
jgi:hypothetical protein